MKAKTILTGMTNMMNMTMTIMIMTRMMLLDHMKVMTNLIKMHTNRPKIAEVRYVLLSGRNFQLLFQFSSNHLPYKITDLLIVSLFCIRTYKKT